MNSLFFLLSKMASLYIRIINSVVVVGFYYGFVSGFFSIGLSYIFLLQAHIISIQEGEKESKEEVSALTGFLLGRLLVFVSIYDRSLALGKPHIICLLVLFCLLILYNTYNYEDLSQPTGQTLMHNPSTQSIFLINFLFQLLNHFFYPSPRLDRLADIYTFFYNKNMSFIRSSFVGWLIGQFLLIECVRFVLVWLQKNYFVRVESYIFSNEYLLNTFLFFQEAILDFQKVMFKLRRSVDKFFKILILFIINFVHRFFGTLILFICLCAFDKMTLPRFTFQIQAGTQEEKAVEPNPQEAEEKKRVAKFIMDINKIGPSHAVLRVKSISEMRTLCEKAEYLEHYEAISKIFSDINKNRPSRAVLIEKCIPALSEKAESLESRKNPGLHYFLSVFRNQSIVSQFLGEFDKYRNKILKQIPRWPYRLVYKTEEGKKIEK